MIFQAAGAEAKAKTEVATVRRRLLLGRRIQARPGRGRSLDGRGLYRRIGPQPHLSSRFARDTTGHAEAVQVTFDPARISYEDLVRKFFSLHDPTQLNRQGPDVGTQYRSVIFVNGPAQKAAAEKVKAESGKGRPVHRGRIVTEIVPAGRVLAGRGIPPEVLREE